MNPNMGATRKLNDSLDKAKLYNTFHVDYVKFSLKENISIGSLGAEW